MGWDGSFTLALFPFTPFLHSLYFLPDMLPAAAHACKALLQEFLSSCALPKLSNEAVETLNAPITADKIEEVLKSLPMGKSPGPDGFNYLYYQTFREHLLPYLTYLYNTFLDGDQILQTIFHSYISLILKPDKDYTDCSNYKPIAFLNILNF